MSHDILVTTLIADDILVVTGITPQDRLLTPVIKAFVPHARNHWRKPQSPGKIEKTNLLYQSTL